MGLSTGTATLISGGIGAASSLLGANSASKEAARQAEEQRRLQQQQLDFQKQMYDKERGYIDPIRDRLTNEAMSGQPLDYARIAAQVKGNYADAARKLGVGAGGSGLARGAQRGMAMQQASTLADAYAQGLTARRGLQQNLLARDQSAALGSQYAGGLGSMAGLAGQNAAMYRNAAQQGWQNFGQGLSGIAYGLASMKPEQGMRDATVPGNMSGLADRPAMTAPPSYGTPPEVGGSPTLFQSYSPSFGQEYFSQPFMGQQPSLSIPDSYWRR